MNHYKNNSNSQFQRKNENHQKSKPTLDDQLENFKNDYFKETYQNLLSLKNENTPLDKVFDSISKFVKKECGNITTSQLRNIYGEIKRANDISSIKMLRPNLAYIGAREPRAKAIVMFFEKLIKEVNTDKELKSFQDVMEAVVAYHKFHHNKK